MESIIEAFRAYFDHSVEIPLPLSEKGSIEDDSTGWTISYVMNKDENGQPYLDFTANHRMTNSRHIRITHDGTVIGLETYQEFYAYDPKIEGDKEVKQQAYYEHNRKVSEILKKKGLE
jgi:hypothetical protein